MTELDAKKALRREIRTQLRALTDRSALDVRLLEAVLAHPWMAEADTVLLYCSMPEEPDTRALLARLLQDGRCAALPVCDTAGQMAFYRIRSLDELQPGAYHIPEPVGREEPLLTRDSLCIVPGLAFAKDGSRLGKGGGYYDRYLAAHPDLRTIGLTYRCLLQEEIPCEAHDRRVDAVITD